MEPEEKAKELGAANYDLAQAVLYSDDESVAFVSYENNIIEIYDVKEKKLINSVDGMENFAYRNKYLSSSDRIDFFIAIESKTVLVVEKSDVVFLAIPCVGQHCWDVVRSIVFRH